MIPYTIPASRLSVPEEYEDFDSRTHKESNVNIQNEHWDPVEMISVTELEQLRRTPFTIACSYGQEHIVRYLVESHSYDVTTCENWGMAGA